MVIFLSNFTQLEARDQESEQLLSSQLSAAQAQLASCQHSLTEVAGQKAALQAELTRLKELLEEAGEELSLQAGGAHKFPIAIFLTQRFNLVKVDHQNIQQYCNSIDVFP